jgi:hypothetical protein
MEVPYVIQIPKLIVGRNILLGDTPSYTASRKRAEPAGISSLFTQMIANFSISSTLIL